jgi:hypothetical protein
VDRVSIIAWVGFRLMRSKAKTDCVEAFTYAQKPPSMSEVNQVNSRGGYDELSCCD